MVKTAKLFKWTSQLGVLVLIAYALWLGGDIKVVLLIGSFMFLSVEGVEYVYDNGFSIDTHDKE